MKSSTRKPLLVMTGTHGMRVPARPPSDWRHRRRRLIARCFGRLFRSLEDTLCKPAALPVRGIHRVLVCRHNHRLGNTLLIGPLIAEIEHLYPGAEIDILVSGNIGRTLYADWFPVHNIVCLPRHIARNLPRTFHLLRQVRRTRYDLAIDACPGSQSGRLFLALANARYKVGFPAIEAEHSSSIVGQFPLPAPKHLAQRGVFLLRSVYAGSARKGYPPLDIRLTAEERRLGGLALQGLLARQPLAPRCVVGIFLAATGAKCYGERWWTQLLDALRALRPNLVLVEVLADDGRSRLDSLLPTFYSRDVRKIAAVISHLDGFISADCGIMHLAVAAGIPTAGLFSITDSAKYAPYGSGGGAIDTPGKTHAEIAVEAIGLIERQHEKVLLPTEEEAHVRPGRLVGA